jgi:uncharacterized protein YlzI (FlbEa/FlbD family)
MKFITVRKTDGLGVTIPLKQIEYIESNGRFSVVRLKSGKNFLISDDLDKIARAIYVANGEVR